MFFSRFARWTAHISGRPPVFTIAVITIIAWGACGPLFNYSDTWQLVINTSTTIITFLMVFLIQNTQNREGEAVQLKLDELIGAVQAARNSLLDLEELSEEELEQIRKSYLKLAEEAREAARAKAGATSRNINAD